MTVKWKLKAFLDLNQLTAYALWKANSVSKTTLYATNADRMDGLQFDTLGKTIGGLEALTKRQISLSEVLDVVREGVT